MSIDAEAWSFSFGLSNRSDVDHIMAFLREHKGRLAYSKLEVGSLFNVPVLLIKDDEFADRFFLRSAGKGQLVNFTFVADELEDLLDATAQAAQDLQAGGLPEGSRRSERERRPPVQER